MLMMRSYENISPTLVMRRHHVAVALIAEVNSEDMIFIAFYSSRAYSFIARPISFIEAGLW